MNLLQYDPSKIETWSNFLKLDCSKLDPLSIETAFIPFFNDHLGGATVEIERAAESRVGCYLHLFNAKVVNDRMSRFMFRLPFSNRCIACNGRGFHYIIDTLSMKCPTCNGSGNFTVACKSCYKGVYFIKLPDKNNKEKIIEKQMRCRKCRNGLIYDSRRKCKHCRGKGDRLVPYSLQKYAQCEECAGIKGSGRSFDRIGNPVLTKEISKQLTEKGIVLHN